MVKGLKCMVMTLANEKASQFGGLNFHRSLLISISSNQPVERQVDASIQKLYRNPQRLTFLKTLDVLVVEELGKLISEKWSVLVQTMRFSNDSNLPVNGILILRSGDPKRRRPPKGPLLWISLLFLATLTFLPWWMCSDDRSKWS